jgi:hypothetical protein
MSKPARVTCQNREKMTETERAATREDDRAERNNGALAKLCSDAS